MGGIEPGRRVRCFSYVPPIPISAMIPGDALLVTSRDWGD